MIAISSFPLRVVLTVTTNRNLLPIRNNQCDTEGLHNIVEYLLGYSCTETEIGHLAEKCRGLLMEQHPQLNNVDKDISSFVSELEAATNKCSVVERWVKIWEARYGSTLPVTKSK